MIGILLRKSILSLAAGSKSVVKPCLTLVVVLTLIAAVSSQKAYASTGSIGVGGGTLSWTVVTSNASCAQSATYVEYEFSGFSFTSSTGVVTPLSGSDNYFAWSGTCSAGVPNGGYPTATVSLVGATFVITFTPQSNGSGSATYTSTQTINFVAPATQQVGTPLTLSATASSGLAVNFTSTTTSVCTVSGTTATFLIAGTCTIDANQAGNSSYAAAPMVAQSFSVDAPQIVTFAPPSTQQVGTPLSLSATATSGLAVGFTSTTPTICTVSGTTATFLAAGTCTIDANQPGNSAYAAAPMVAQSFTVVGAPQTVTFVIPGTQAVGTPLALSATATSGLAVSFSSATTSVCTVSGSTATFLIAGTCTIDANQAGSRSYAAAPMVAQSFTVLGDPQNINFATPATQTVGTPLTLSATATSGLTVSFTSTTASVCTVSGATATFLIAGTCTIDANQAGNSSYAVAPMVAQSFTVGGDPQNINFATPATQTVGTPLTLSATATSGLTVSFTSTTASVCTVSGATAAFLTAGTCTIDANQAGNTAYAAAPMVPQSFTVAGMPQTIGFANPGAQRVGTPLTLSATASSSLAVSFTSATTSICTVSGATATFLAVGTCIVDANQAGSSTYAAASMVPQSFTVNVALTSQTITFATPGTQIVGTPLALSATASSSLAVSFTSTTSSICTVSGTTATFLAAGTCTIDANQAGNSTYAAAPMVPQSFVVAGVSQTITFPNPGTQRVGLPLTLSATSSSGLVVGFTSTTASVCTVSGTSATFLVAGTCTIDANQAGNSTHAAAPMVPQSFTVNAALTPQTITFGNPGTQSVATPLTLSATATSSLAVTFASTTPSICTVSGATATFLVPGTCLIQANQPGNTIYAAAPMVSQSFKVRGAATAVAGNIPMFNTPSAPSTSTLTNSGITQASTGNIGIGAPSPASKLDIGNYGTGVSIDPGDGATTFGTLAFNQEATTGAILSPAAYAFQFTHTGSTTAGSDYLALQVSSPTGTKITPAALVVTGAGNVGIGTASPANTLTVNSGGQGNGGEYLYSSAAGGSIEVVPNMSAGDWNPMVQTGDSGIMFTSTSGEGTGAFDIVPWSATAAGFRINNLGHVGIGTTAPAYSLDVAGQIRSSSGGVVFPDGTTQTTAFTTSGASLNSILTSSNGNVDATGNIVPGGDGVIRSMVPLAMLGGDSVISGNSWQRVTRTTYSSIANLFAGTAILPGATRQYYLVIRKADNVPSGGTGSNWRFACEGVWNSGTDVPGHGFAIPTDWGSLDEGTTQWVQIPPSAIPACSTPYWKLDAEMTSAAATEGASMRVMSVTMAAVDVNAGTNAAYSAAASGNDSFPTVTTLNDNLSSTGAYGSGYVGIGTTAPTATLEVNGNIKMTKNLTSPTSLTFSDGTTQTTAYTGISCGGDYAETVDVSGDRKNYQPGDVLVIGAQSGADVLKSAEPYSTLVAGIYSTKPGVVGRRQTSDAKTSTTEVPMAMVGIVPTKVTAENGPIRRGDLLVTSSLPGYAMKGTDRTRMLGAVVGKALGSLDSGTGLIEVLVSLQ